MSASPRRSQVRIAYSSIFATQVDFDTALLDAALDAVFSLDDTEPALEIVTAEDEILDCSTQYLTDVILNARSSRLSFGIYPEAETLFGLLGLAMGVVAGDTVSMLGPTVFQGPATTLIWGHEEVGASALKFKGMVLNSITITVPPSPGRITVQVEFRGHGAPEAVSFDFPDCADVLPIQIKDCALSVNSVDVLADTREFNFNYSNELLFEEDPFTLASIDITRMERADRRTNILNWRPFGEPGDANHAAALALTKMPFEFRIGPTGDGVEVAALSSLLRQAGSPTHEGQARRSVLSLSLTPLKQSAVLSPIIVTRVEES